MITIDNASIVSITPFDRVNTHVNLLYPEHFVAITIVGVDDGRYYVTMTRKHSKFASTVRVGGTLTISGKVKREQDYNQLGGQIVLTNCMIGIPAYEGLKATRKDKIATRLAKLLG